MSRRRVVIAENTPLAPYTTLKVGGPARLFCSASSMSEIEEAMTFARENYLPVVAIGGGSNLLVEEQGYPGLVLRVQSREAELDLNGSEVTCFAGASTIAIAQATARMGLAGLEWAAGIPGNIGGAVVMNAGAHGHEMAEFVSEVTVLLPDGRWQTLSKQEIGYAYRHSSFPEGSVVAAVTFRLYPGNRDVLQAQISEYKEYRRRTQPWGARTAGCFFRNPQDCGAGQLIDRAGLKGARIGDAEVSTIHGNFLINNGDATYSEFMELIEYVRTKVRHDFDQELLLEVVRLGPNGCKR